MRAFLLGFASGVLALAVVLGLSGALKRSGPIANPAPSEASREAEAPPPPQSSSPLPALAPAPVAPLNLPEPGLPSARLLFPVPGIDPKTVTDTFNQGRAGGNAHEAIDIMAPRGTPVVAVDEGNVVKLFHSKRGGITVYQFDNSRTWCYYYAHLDRYAEGLREGVLLRRGDRLGYVGSTGDSSPDAPHLHFALFKLGPEKHWWQGTAVDPYPLLMGGIIGSK